jgi:hypothetical protein
MFLILIEVMGFNDLRCKSIIILNKNNKLAMLVVTFEGKVVF